MIQGGKPPRLLVDPLLSGFPPRLRHCGGYSGNLGVQAGTGTTELLEIKRAPFKIPIDRAKTLIVKTSYGYIRRFC